ncbi:MAG: MFS transporter [Blastocatellia bacterium]
MNALKTEAAETPIGLARLPIYYGWVNLAVAALAMVGTLPGRTQGLGLITESLLKDLQIDRVAFAQINLWATLIGALFCFGIGRLIDRAGSRVMLTAVVLSLGTVVLLMSGVRSVLWLAVLITLTRGLGQSALSVISLTMVGQWFMRRLSLAMGVYTVVLSIGFMIAFPVVGAIVINNGWRTAWGGIGGVLLLGLAPVGWLLARHTPESSGLAMAGETSGEKPDAQITGATLWQALRTPAFWVFALSSSIYGLIASGIALFNESILAERGFDAAMYYRTLVITALTALAGNFLGGWMAEKWTMNRLMTLAMTLLAGSLVALPHVRTELHVVAYAVVMGVAGGFVIVLFFSFWSRAFGRAHLGKIQGAAQSLTVLASALGPLLLAECVARTGSYAMMFYILSLVVAALGISAWFVSVPNQGRVTAAS